MSGNNTFWEGFQEAPGSEPRLSRGVRTPPEEEGRSGLSWKGRSVDTRARKDRARAERVVPCGWGVDKGRGTDEEATRKGSCAWPGKLPEHHEGV